jgi:alpha-beta hydrolase superfamily lysophospholipase
MKRLFDFARFACAVVLLNLAGVTSGAPPEVEVKIPDPLDVTLQTKDFVDLRATYYAGTKEKDSAAVILLHGWKQRRKDFETLALLLQSQGNAVVTVDLRGHGESIKIQPPWTAKPAKIDAASLRPDDFRDMVRLDMEAVKSFLVIKNNDGALNVDELCVVGLEMGAIIAATWAQSDWNDWPPLTTGKQGQDVKGLVLISPESNFKGLHLMEAVNDPVIRSQLAILVIAGKENSHFASEANRLHQHFEKYRTDSANNELYFVHTKMQGERLLRESNSQANAKIARFVRRIADQHHPWAQRYRPGN